VTQARADLFVSNRGRRFGRARFSRLGSAPASRAPASRSNLVFIQRLHRGHRRRIRRRSHRQPGPGRRRTPGAPKDFIKTSQHQLFKHSLQELPTAATDSTPNEILISHPICLKWWRRQDGNRSLFQHRKRRRQPILSPTSATTTASTATAQQVRVKVCPLPELRSWCHFHP